MWLTAACTSAFFAGITAILAKCGVQKTDSDIATGIRTAVVLIFAWLIVFMTGAQNGIGLISGKTFLFLILSGLATGASWLCYFRALSIGDVNKVVPVDKSGIILAVIFGILFFHETEHIAVRLICTAGIAAGVLLMIEKKESVSNRPEKRGWFLWALLSAFFAAVTTCLAKVGFEKIDANLGTAIRTVVILIMAWLIVGIKRKIPLLKSIPIREAGFLILSGLSTGISWLCYFSAVQKGPISVIVPIDRLSIIVTIIFSRIVFGEHLTKRSAFGLFLMVAGTIGMTLA